MPLGPGRRGVGVIGGPVAKTAVVAAAVSPGPSPVAKAAVVGSAMGPGPSPVAKAAVVGSAMGPGPSPVAKAAVVGRGRHPGPPAVLAAPDRHDPTLRRAPRGARHRFRVATA